MILRMDADGTSSGTVESALTAMEADISGMQELIGGVSISAKADKVVNATADHFASLDATGNLKDSGATVNTFAPKSHTHDASQIIGTASKVPVFGTDGAMAASGVTANELAYLIGVTSSVQTQIDSKIAASLIGAINGVASLTADKVLVDTQVPDLYKHMIPGTLDAAGTTFTDINSVAVTPSVNTLYYDTATFKILRYDTTTSAYVEAVTKLELGELATQAFRGDFGLLAYNHARSDHARTDATAVAASATNGNVKINGTETTVYTHPTTEGSVTSAAITTSRGGTFDVVSAITASNGHVSTYEKTTVTLPNGVDLSLAKTQPTTQQTDDLWLQEIQ